MEVESHAKNPVNNKALFSFTFGPSGQQIHEESFEKEEKDPENEQEEKVAMAWSICYFMISLLVLFLGILLAKYHFGKESKKSEGQDL